MSETETDAIDSPLMSECESECVLTIEHSLSQFRILLISEIHRYLSAFISILRSNIFSKS